MQSRLIAYPPDQAAIGRTLAPGESLRVGRGADCGIVIAHPSVSRHHAALVAGQDGCQLRDLRSKNGSFVDGERTETAKLSRACWLRLGDVYCEFDLLDAAQAAARDAGLRARRELATAHTARLDGVEHLDALLDASLRGVLELAQCDRGFVLLGDGDAHPFAVRASLALDPARLSSAAFSGSVGAVNRALDGGHSVVANDIGHDRWLSARASVIAGGLRALVCVPLLDGEQRLGAIYADRTHAGPAITTLDLALLEAFAERASLWLAAHAATRWLDREHAGAQSAPWSRILAAHAEHA